MVANTEHYFTPDEYLEWEQQQGLRYEYINGEVFAMTGGTIPHNTIAVNLATAIRNHIRGTGCRVFINDAKLGITEKGPFHYPDVMVSCDERDRRATKFVQYPCLIVEVLSDSTEAYDRGDKFRAYRRIETLQEYILVEQKRQGCDRYRRNERGTWELYSYEETDEVQLDSINFSFLTPLLYEDVEFLP